MANLALLGGDKLVKEEFSTLFPQWPPRDEETAEALKKVYMDGFWSFNSPSELEFEQAFAEYHGAKYGIFMANGTTTLECAMAALGVKAGDEVIVPALTWMATALAASYLGAIPVIVDIEPDTLCMDPEKVRSAITPKTRAIIPVHAYGSTADMERILEIADAHNIPVIEDCAHMHGGFWNGRGVGSWGKVGSFSFQQSKTMSSGEGGICITNDPELAEKIYLLKHIGYSRGVQQGQARKAPESLLCHNYRATAFQAVILSQQLKNLKNLINTYAENAAYLREAIKDIPGVRMQSPGRLSEPQGYYSCHLIFDGEPFKNIPKPVINDACRAEGFPIGNGTHGPVYRAGLFNLDLAKGEYRIHEGRSAVCEDMFTRTLGCNHYVLTRRSTVEKLSAVLHKVYANIGELEHYAAAQ